MGAELNRAVALAFVLFVAACGASGSKPPGAATPLPRQRGEAERFYDLCRHYFDDEYTPETDAKAEVESAKNMTEGRLPADPRREDLTETCIGLTRYVSGDCMEVGLAKGWKRSHRFCTAEIRTPIDCILYSSRLDDAIKDGRCYPYTSQRLVDVVPAAVSWVQEVWPTEASPPSCLSGRLDEIRREGEDPIRPSEDDAQYAERMRSAREHVSKIIRVMDGTASLADLRAFSDEHPGFNRGDRDWFSPECRRLFLKGAARAATTAYQSKLDDEADKKTVESKKQRADVLHRRFIPIQDDCRANWLAHSNKCTELPGLSEEERADCQRACTAAGQEGYRSSLSASQKACADGKGTPKCELTRPPNSYIGEAQFSNDLSSCVVACRDDRKAEAAKEQARAASATRQTLPQGGTTGASSGKKSCIEGCRVVGQSCVSKCTGGNQECAMKCVRQRNMCWNGCE